MHISDMRTFCHCFKHLYDYFKGQETITNPTVQFSQLFSSVKWSGFWEVHFRPTLGELKYCKIRGNMRRRE